jgi:hypothetical protein
MSTARSSKRAPRHRPHNILFASGSKGHEVRANGNGGFLARGYYFRADGQLNGPFANLRIAMRQCDRSALHRAIIDAEVRKLIDRWQAL